MQLEAAPFFQPPPSPPTYPYFGRNIESMTFNPQNPDREWDGLDLAWSLPLGDQEGLGNGTTQNLPYEAQISSLLVLVVEISQKNRAGLGQASHSQ